MLFNIDKDVLSLSLEFKQKFENFSGDSDSSLISCDFTNDIVKISDFQLIINFKDCSIYRNIDTQNDTRYVFSYLDTMAVVDKDFSNVHILRYYFRDNRKWKQIYEILLLTLRFKIVKYGGLVSHASAVIHAGEAVLFSGRSGAGKSTQALCWKRTLNSWVLNYDKPCILKEGDRFYSLGTPWSGKEDCYINASSPIKAIVFVEQSSVNSVLKLTPSIAFSMLFSQYYTFPISVDVEKSVIKILEDIVNIIPIYRLCCKVTEEAVKTLFEAVFSRDYIIEKERFNMVYKISNEFIMREIAGECVVFPRGEKAIGYNAVTVLNETGSLLWNAMKKGATENALIKILVKEYGINTELAAKDVSEFIQKMISENMIVYEK